MPSKNSSFRRSQRALRIEPLENRRLFAADLGVADDYWVIHGTEGDDVITVEQNGVMLTAWVNEEAHYKPSFLCKGITVHGKAGVDSIRIDNSVTLPTRLHGGNGDDTIVGGPQDDVISGGWGNDKIYSRAGDDQVWGDQMPVPQSPLLRPNNGLVEQVGLVVQPRRAGEVEPPASDTIWGGVGDDAIHGGPGNDVLFGEGPEISSTQPPAPQHPGLLQQPDPNVYPLYSYDDKIYGDEGVDFLHGGPGEDFFHGGADVDIVFAVDGNVDDILPGPGDIIFADPFDRFAPWQPELEPSSPAPSHNASTVDSLITSFYIDESASQPGPALTALPTNRTDFFDDPDDWLEDLIDDWPWDE